MVANIIADDEEGDLPPEIKAYGTGEPSIQSFELCPGWQKPELVEIVDTLTEQINNGEIGMPDGV
jgi:hypothetical protein